ncbi:MAG: ATP-binding protein [Clostridium sp.]|nr:ATP-binding protein [Clostridium sp.]
MNKKIFRSSVAVALVVLLSSIVLIMGILFQYFENQLQSELESEANYIAYAVENQGVDYINNFTNSSKRITLISPDGDVLADTSADKSELDDHSNRQEVVEALKNGSGKSVRYSKTLAEKTIYYALKMSDGNVLRVSTTQYTVAVIIISLIQPILIVFVIAIALSFVLSQRVSKAIIKPINELDLDNPSSNEPYDELAPLLRKISKQKKTIENQIKEAKQKQEEFRLITENMKEGFLVVDRHTNLLTYNHSASVILDIDSDDCLDNFKEVIGKALDGKRAESDLTLGETNYNLIANPVFEDEEIIGAVIIIIDVTESVKREQLRREFTSNVSHELKTPLTSISGFAEMLKAGDAPNSVITDFSKSIYDEAQRLITLVNDIIKISELDENNIQAEKEKVDLFELSADIIKRLSPVANKKNIKLNLIGESTSVIGTEKILDEMIYNLCDNAIKYNIDGGTVDVIISESSRHIRLTVRDTGIGIPQSEQERIFERFYRVDKSHSKAIGGTGLGLSIVKHAAIYHNAKIELKSEPGKGTSVIIIFKK